MVAPTQEQYEVEDIDIEVPQGGSDQEIIPQGMYTARLVKLKTVAKPDWKLKGEEGEDREQYEWVFEIVEGDWQGYRLNDYTNRTFHPKATAHKHAAALFGVPELVPGIHTSTRALAGKACQIWIIEKATQQGKGPIRNYIEKVTPMPTPRARPQRPQAAPTIDVVIGSEFDERMAQRRAQATQTPAGVPQVHVPQLDREDDFWAVEDEAAT